MPKKDEKSLKQLNRDKDGEIRMFNHIPTLKSYCDKLQPEYIFEWGPGKSTEYFLSLPYLKKIFSVENDKYFYQKLKNKFKDDRLNLIHEEAWVKNSSFAHKIFDMGQNFDLIFVDGRNRVECILASIQNLAPGGVIILHDCYRKNYLDLIEPIIEIIERDKDTLVMKPKYMGR